MQEEMHTIDGVAPLLESSVPCKPGKRIVHLRVLLFMRKRGALAQ